MEVICWMIPVFTATAAAIMFPALCADCVDQFPVVMAFGVREYGLPDTKMAYMTNFVIWCASK